MSAIGRHQSAKRASWRMALFAVTRYELLWNLRKKKFLGMFVVALALATVSLMLPVLLRGLTGQAAAADPDYVVRTGTGITGFGFILFAVVVAMNSLSGEFESGTIIPLLVKPVSRTTVFWGKVLAAFLTILATYAVLLLYMALAGWWLYGPQQNLHLLTLALIGSILSTFVWISFVLALGALSKSSLLAALGALGLWFGLTIATGILATFSDQAWVLTYLPGSGAGGFILGTDTGVPFAPGLEVETGTDYIAGSSVTFVLHPAAEVTFMRLSPRLGGPPSFTPLYTEALSFIVVRAILLAVAYFSVFMGLAWAAFKRAEVAE